MYDNRNKHASLLQALSNGERDTHSDSLLPIPKRNLASYPVIVRGGVSEMIA